MRSTTLVARGTGLAVVLILLLALACAKAAPTATLIPPTPTRAPAPTPTPTVAVSALTPAPTATVARPIPTPTVIVPSPTATLGPRGSLNVIDDLSNELWVPRMASAQPWHWMAENLLGKDRETLKLIPNLAESWKLDLKPDGSVDWNIKVRAGVQFHGGWGEVEASDLKYSLLQYMKPGSVATNASAFADWYGKDPDRIEVKGKYELVIHATRMDALIWDQLSRVRSTSLTAVPAKYMEQVGEEGFDRKPIGNGPFEFVEQKRAQYVKLRAFTKSWRKVPGFAELTVFKVLEPSTQFAMVRTGKVDIVRVFPRLKKEIEAAGVKIIRSPSVNETYVVFGGMFLPTRPKYDPTVPWAGDNPINERPRMVRQAMNLAVDKQAIIDKVLSGEAVPSSVTFSFVPGTPYFNPEWKPYPYDPKKARELLVQAGYPNGFDLQFWFILQYNVDVAQAVASYLEQAGIKVKSTVVEYSPTVRSRLINRDTAGQLYVYEQPNISDPLSYGGRVGGPSTSTILHTESQLQDILYAKMFKELDQDKVNQIIRELGDEYYRQYWTMPISHTNGLFAVSGNITGWEPFPHESPLTRLEYAVPAK
ncbi:MAG: ABC transporter substrate-binding protein [Chloroflexi bacterium]|nr:ABC transporter substrate-binding protein [Chloroflexota bacterium]